MNCDLFETKTLIQKILLCDNKFCEVVLFIPATNLLTASELIKNSKIQLGAQNCHWENSGAFTGEISPQMLKSVGTEYVIIGHSERRLYFGETDETINMRVKNALSSRLKVIVCVGENLSERESGITFERLSEQLKLALLNVEKEKLENVIIAYEPVWAIGSGKTASSEQAQEACLHLRKVVQNLYGETSASHIRILYGGSMNSKNAESLLSKPNIDGGLIGGASLKADEFIKIIKVADTI